MKKIKKENLKIALVSLQKDAEKIPPIGLVHLASHLKEKSGIQNIKIIDKNFDNIYSELEKFSPDIIGISSMSVNYPDAVELATNLKNKSNVPIIIGGVHISTCSNSFKSCFDIGVIGEGEETLVELVNIYLRKGIFTYKELNKIKGIGFLKNNTFKKTKLRNPINLETLTIPDFDFVNKDYFSEQEIPGANITARRAFIFTSRSCPYKCIFCSTSHFWGNLRLHSPKYVARLIKDSIIRYKTSYIKILDDLFTINLERLKKIKEELEKLGMLKYIRGIECQPRANLINEELCKLMKELKIKIVNFGFESGSENVLKKLKGGSVTIEMNKKAIILCKKYGFIVYGSLMFGSPGEKIEDIKKTLNFIDFAIKNKADYLWSFISTPFPDTPFWKIALDRGKVSNNMDFRILGIHNINNPLLLDDDVDKIEFKKLFLLGRKRLRILKIRMIINFLMSNPSKSLVLFIKYPVYYFQRIIKQVYKH